MNFKTLSLATAIAAISVSSQAEQKFYVGVEAFTGSGSLEQEIETTSGLTASGDIDTDQTGQTLVFGLLGQNNIRTNFKYTSVDAETENDFEIELSGLDVDWNFGFAQSEKVLPYAMAGFGYYTWKDSAEAFQLADDDDLNGIALNLGIGAAFKVHEAIELDASYRYKGIFWQQMEDSQGTTLDVTSTSYDLTLGARFLF